MFPVAILFGGVLLTILIGLHVVLVSVGRTAVQAAADRGVTAAQAAPIGGGGDTFTCESQRECEGVIATLRALDTSGAMVRQAGPPLVEANETAGVVTVAAFGAVLSPVFGEIEIVGYACGPLELIAGIAPSPVDASAC